MSESGTRTTTRLANGAAESLKLYREWAQIVWGTSEREIPEKDARFADEAAEGKQSWAMEEFGEP
jgi:hypothetical protein